MEIIDTIELPSMDERIWKFFNILIDTKPLEIRPFGTLIYKINGVDVSLQWKPERKNPYYRPYVFKNPLIDTFPLNDFDEKLCANQNERANNGRIYFIINTPYKSYTVRTLNPEEQYIYQKKLFELYFTYDINYLNQFLPKSNLPGIELKEEAFNKVLDYEQKIITDSKRCKDN